MYLYMVPACTRRYLAGRVGDCGSAVPRGTVPRLPDRTAPFSARRLAVEQDKTPQCRAREGGGREKKVIERVRLRCSAANAEEHVALVGVEASRLCAVAPRLMKRRPTYEV